MDHATLLLGIKLGVTGVVLLLISAGGGAATVGCEPAQRVCVAGVIVGAILFLGAALWFAWTLQ